MDFLLKQRLVGAVVLVALGVIFIPLLLEGPGQELVPEMEPMPGISGPGDSIELSRFPDAGEVPEEPAVAVLQKDAPDSAAGATDAAVAGQPLPLPEAAEKPATTDKVKTPEAPVEKPATAAAEAPASKPVEPAKPTGPLGNWVVQMGSFSSEANALRLRDKLRKAGYVTQVEKVRVDAKVHYRVRVGPYLQRDEADRDQAKLAKQFNPNARVLSYP